MRDPKQRAVDESIEETFPASDAPASHVPDVPPANAAEKWRAARRAANDPREKYDGGEIRDVLQQRKEFEPAPASSTGEAGNEAPGADDSG